MIRFAIFFALSLSMGWVVILSAVHLLVPNFLEKPLLPMLSVIPIFTLFFSVPCALLGVIARHFLGRLSGFTAGIIATTCSLATVKILFGSFMTTDLAQLLDLALAGFMGPYLLAQTPFFRQWALGWSPASRFTSFAGTYVCSVAETETPAQALGRRDPAERRWAMRTARMPSRWDECSEKLTPSPRRVPLLLTATHFLGKRAFIGWSFLALGIFAVIGWLRLDCVRGLGLRAPTGITKIVSRTCQKVVSNPWEFLLYGRATMFVSHGRYFVDKKPYHVVRRDDDGCYGGPSGGAIVYAIHDPRITSKMGVQEILPWSLGLPLLALALFRAGVIRVHEGARLARLLGTGSVVFADSEGQVFPDFPPTIVTSTEVQGHRIAIVTPRPMTVGGRQALLVDADRKHVVAWDLLPTIPGVALDGSLVEPLPSKVLPWIFGSLVLPFALVILWWAT